MLRDVQLRHCSDSARSSGWLPCGAARFVPGEVQFLTVGDVTAASGRPYFLITASAANARAAWSRKARTPGGMCRAVGTTS